MRQLVQMRLSAEPSARVCACGGSHGRSGLGNHFEIDSRLSKSYCLVVSLSSGKRIARFKAHDIVTIPGGGDEQGMNFFLETVCLQAKLVHIAHLRRGGHKFKD